MFLAFYFTPYVWVLLYKIQTLNSSQEREFDRMICIKVTTDANVYNSSVLRQHFRFVYLFTQQREFCLENNAVNPCNIIIVVNSRLKVTEMIRLLVESS